jgi:two-component system, sensor histidine kinase and response regulator
MNSADDVLNVLLEHLPDAVYLKDAQQRFIRISRTLASWYGLKSPAAAVGKTDAEFLGRDFAKTSDEADADIMRSGIPKIGLEEKRVWPDGRVTWTSTSRVPVRDATGVVVGLLGIFTDISPLLQAQKETRRAEALYRSLVDSLPQCFFQKDLQGRVAFANRRYCLTLGKSLKELVGKTDFDLFPQKLARKYREDDAHVLQTGVVLDTVEAHTPPGKRTMFVRVIKTAMYDAEQRAVGVQGIFWQVPSEKAPEMKPAAKRTKKKPRARTKRRA